MDLLEYQGKRYLARYGLPVPEGEVAGSVQEAGERADALGYPVAVKAQVATGGRGKAGGIRLAGDRAQAEEAAGAILGMDIRGHRVRLLWLERAVEVATEHYASSRSPANRIPPALPRPPVATWTFTATG